MKPVARRITASRLRADVYNILDEVVASGQPVEINRKGVTLRIVAAAPVSKLDRLKKARRKTWVGDRNDIFRINWLQYWDRNGV